jgi:methionine--tRNA ligase beta chain
MPKRDNAVAKSMDPERTQPTSQSEPQTPATPEITFDEFMRLDMRVGKILEVIPVINSKKLMRVMVDFGAEKRQAIAGLVAYYKPEELVGKKCVFLLNLKRRMIAGFESQCMILAAEDDKGVVAVLQPEKDVAEGSKVG